MADKDMLDCIIVGGGSAGIGVGAVLKDLGVKRFIILERDSVGASFGLWPQEMRLITPSFTSNAYGMLDLNAIAIKTSPAYTLGVEHPSGEQYSDYLQAVASFKELPVEEGIDVLSVEPLEEGGYKVETSSGSKYAHHVVWAAGEFQYPRLEGFTGAEFCIHNALVPAWKELEGDDFIIIGGYESGIDAAINLSRLGKRSTVIDRSGRWETAASSDPSVELSPYTRERLAEELDKGLITLMSGYEVQWVEPDGEGFAVYGEQEGGESLLRRTLSAPILASGFSGSLPLVDELFAKGEDGRILLSGQDESTLNPGLFLAGPSVRHGGLHFCFIYKFRQRFAVIARAIGRNLGLDLTPLEEYRAEGMLLEDLSCCGEDCRC